MASKKKRTSGRKSSGRKYTKSKSRSKSTSVRFDWQSEVLLFAVLAFSIILFISNIGRGGVVGNAISHFFFGVFGLMSYAFPFLLFFVTAFLISNQRTPSGRNPNFGRAVMKAVAGILFFVFLCVFSHLVYMGGQTESIIPAYLDCAESKAGGGVLGAAVGSALIRAFGIAGAYVVDFAVLILSVVLITEKSLFAGLTKRRHSDEAARQKREALRQQKLEKKEAAERQRQEQRETQRQQKLEQREAAKQQREAAERQREADERRRGKKPVKGVSLDTDLSHRGPKPTSEKLDEIDMSEMNALDKAAKKGRRKAAEVKDAAEEVTDQQADTFWESRKQPQIHMPGDPSAADTGAAAKRQKENLPFEQEMPAAEEIPSAKKRTKKTRQSDQEISSDVSDISKVIHENAQEISPRYVFPDVNLLKRGDPNQMGDSRQHLQEMSARLQMTLETFGVNAHVTNVICGPAVTQYEIHPEMGVKVSKIVNLADDIKLNLAVPDIRIEAPIPGKAAIGIEVPNKENVTVAFRDLVESKAFQSHPSKISFCAGKDIAGNVIIADIAKMPHLLIAGATGSGKSVCINTIIMSILYKADPNEVKLIMIDPKVVELSVYNNIPHLLIPVVTDPKKAAGALHWAVAEMTDRYQKFAEYGVRDIKGYNKKVDSIADIEDDSKPQKMTQIIVIVDELADLMMVAPGDVEDAICRLAQLARAAGIHLIIATQRPSVNVITGLIKANMPSRIAFSVTSGVDSRTILDMNGAEKLLGKGDMLFYPQGYAKPLRVQGAFVSDKEVSDVVDYIIAKNGQVSYNAEIEEKVKSSESNMGSGSGFTSSADDRDTYFKEAGRFIIDKEKGSIGMLQRNFKIGFNRAARIMDQLEEAGVVGPEEGTKPRRVLMDIAAFEQFLEQEDS